jgi:cellulose synthase/poly-beta-1,6-N-acetylglucosamine synthase-like glycosyltransferase
MDERPLVSVVIPTRNRVDLLSDALGSLVEQDYPADRYEILVVDDGSIDDTPSVVEALAQAHSKPRLSLLRQPAKNQDAARNVFRRTAQRVRDAARGRQTPIVRQRRVWRASLAICPSLSVL